MSINLMPKLTDIISKMCSLRHLALVVSTRKVNKNKENLTDNAINLLAELPCQKNY